MRSIYARGCRHDSAGTSYSYVFFLFSPMKVVWTGKGFEETAAAYWAWTARANQTREANR